MDFSPIKQRNQQEGLFKKCLPHLSTCVDQELLQLEDRLGSVSRGAVQTTIERFTFPHKYKKVGQNTTQEPSRVRAFLTRAVQFVPRAEKAHADEDRGGGGGNGCRREMHHLLVHAGGRRRRQVRNAPPTLSLHPQISKLGCSFVTAVLETSANIIKL